MPEGDSIHSLARMLRPHLEGRAIDRARLRERGDLPRLRGVVVERIEAHGKHLLIALDNRWTVRVHLGLNGRLRHFPRSTGRQPPLSANLVLSTHERDFVWSRTKEVELFPTRHRSGHPALSKLGPDLTVPASVDWDRVLRRARSARGPLAEVLLDQKVAAGIGNVIKSETLFLCRVDPFVPVESLADSKIEKTYRTASELLAANVGPGPRRTIGHQTRPRKSLPTEPLQWVYGRAGEPCRKCSHEIAARRHGIDARVTYWCPNCQRRASEPSA